MKRFRITVCQGVIHVNSVHARQLTDTAILLDVDVEQKRPAVGYFWDGATFGVNLWANADTLNVKQKDAGGTEIRFHGLRSSAWTWLAEANKYTVTISLIKRGRKYQTMKWWGHPKTGRK